MPPRHSELPPHRRSRSHCRRLGFTSVRQSRCYHDFCIHSNRPPPSSSLDRSRWRRLTVVRSTEQWRHQSSSLPRPVNTSTHASQLPMLHATPPAKVVGADVLSHPGQVATPISFSVQLSSLLAITVARSGGLLPPRLAPPSSFDLMGCERSQPARSCNLVWLWAKLVASKVAVALSSMAEVYFKSFFFFPISIQINSNFGISYQFEYCSKIHGTNSVGFLISSSIQ
jgi:hypothetical protein